MRRQPGKRTASEAALLAEVDRLGRRAVEARATRLDLDEDQPSTVARDQVDLDPIGADVARDDAIPSFFEESGGSRFPLASESLTVLRHGPTRVGMGTLHIVATPIGNLEDVTLRALRVLREVDWVLAEDTRRTRVLLDHFAIPQKPTSLHAHNEAGRIESVIEALEADRSVALVSDAGTPLVSDPGARLVAAVAAAGHRVEAVPGPSALLAALAVAGLETDRVLFLGFLPRKAGARRRLLELQRGRAETLVLFESPRRVAKTLSEIVEILGDRDACLARELTKRHEEVLRERASTLAARLAAEPPRGECTLVIAGADGDAVQARSIWTDDELDEAIGARFAAGSSLRDLARELATRSGRSRGDVYARAVDWQKNLGASEASGASEVSGEGGDDDDRGTR